MKNAKVFAASEPLEGVKHEGDKPNYSGERDYQIGAYRHNGMTHNESPSGFSEKEMAETGLNMREKL